MQCEKDDDVKKSALAEKEYKWLNGTKANAVGKQ